jgi:hypothetical protein
MGMNNEPPSGYSTLKPRCAHLRQSPYPYLKPLRVYVRETAFLGGWSHQDAIDAQAASGTVERQELSFSIKRENKIISLSLQRRNRR